MSVKSDFGAYAPTRFQSWARQRASNMSANWLGRRASMVMRRLAGANSGRPFDVEIFGTEKARLHPYDNICEKRVYATPQFWDLAERRLLADAVAGSGSRTFCFADIGANVGLYSFFVRSVARAHDKSFRVVAVEPAHEVRARFAFNLEASNAGDAIQLLPWAVTAEHGDVPLTVNRRNRGESRIGGVSDSNENEKVIVPGRPLVDVLETAGFDHVDAMKIDIEGAERPVLEAFFGSCRKALWPEMIIMETRRARDKASLLDLCLARGYALKLQTKLNSVLSLGR